MVGKLSLDFLWLQAADSYGLRLLIHTPLANSGTAEKVERLLTIERRPQLPAKGYPAPLPK